jgi:hypothetical protein
MHLIMFFLGCIKKLSEDGSMKNNRCDQGRNFLRDKVATIGEKTIKIDFVEDVVAFARKTYP